MIIEEKNEVGKDASEVEDESEVKREKGGWDGRTGGRIRGRAGGSVARRMGFPTGLAVDPVGKHLRGVKPAGLDQPHDLLDPIAQRHHGCLGPVLVRGLRWAVGKTG